MKKIKSIQFIRLPRRFFALGIAIDDDVWMNNEFESNVFGSSITAYCVFGRLYVVKFMLFKTDLVLLIKLHPKK